MLRTFKMKRNTTSKKFRYTKKCIQKGIEKERLRKKVTCNMLFGTIYLFGRESRAYVCKHVHGE